MVALTFAVTVEKGSWCWKGDLCDFNSSNYHYTAAEKITVVNMDSD